MSRSGYSDDCEDLELYRRTVKNALFGKRGQAFLREMLATLDAMPEKRLVAYAFDNEGDVCALGAVGRARGIDLPKGDLSDDIINTGELGRMFGIARCMAAEIMFENDDNELSAQGRSETPEERFGRMRGWVIGQLSFPESRSDDGA